MDPGLSVSRVGGSAQTTRHEAGRRAAAHRPRAVRRDGAVREVRRRGRRDHAAPAHSRRARAGAARARTSTRRCRSSRRCSCSTRWSTATSTRCAVEDIGAIEVELLDYMTRAPARRLARRCPRPSGMSEAIEALLTGGARRVRPQDVRRLRSRRPEPRRRCSHGEARRRSQADEVGLGNRRGVPHARDGRLGEARSDARASAGRSATTPARCARSSRASSRRAIADGCDPAALSPLMAAQAAGSHRDCSWSSAPTAGCAAATTSRSAGPRAPSSLRVGREGIDVSAVVKGRRAETYLRRTTDVADRRARAAGRGPA